VGRSVHRAARAEIFNLGKEPHERADNTSNAYWDWILGHSFFLVPAQAVVAQLASTFLEFPFTQKPVSFGITHELTKTRAGLLDA
jgi:hypothetical protein